MKTDKPVMHQFDDAVSHYLYYTEYSMIDVIPVDEHEPNQVSKSLESDNSE